MHPSRRESIGGEQKQPAYRAKNPQGLVPALEVGGAVFGQSMAIFEHLEEAHPEPPLLPRDPVERARVRGSPLTACHSFTDGPGAAVRMAAIAPRAPS